MTRLQIHCILSVDYMSLCLAASITTLALVVCLKIETLRLNIFQWYFHVIHLHHFGQSSYYNVCTVCLRFALLEQRSLMPAMAAGAKLPAVHYRSNNLRFGTCVYRYLYGEVDRALFICSVALIDLVYLFNMCLVHVSNMFYCIH